MNQATELRRRAKELMRQQQEHRGWTKSVTLEGKPCLLLGPYKPTPESEARGRELLALRRRIGREEAKRGG